MSGTIVMIAVTGVMRRKATAATVNSADGADADTVRADHMPAAMSAAAPVESVAAEAAAVTVVEVAVAVAVAAAAAAVAVAAVAAVRARASAAGARAIAAVAGVSRDGRRPEGRRAAHRTPVRSRAMASQEQHRQWPPRRRPRASNRLARSRRDPNRQVAAIRWSANLDFSRCQAETLARV
jgi:hypothetical protein